MIFVRGYLKVILRSHLEKSPTAMPSGNYKIPPFWSLLKILHSAVMAALQESRESHR